MKRARQLDPQFPPVLPHAGARNFRTHGIAVRDIEEVINTSRQVVSSREFSAGDSQVGDRVAPESNSLQSISVTVVLQFESGGQLESRDRHEQVGL